VMLSPFFASRTHSRAFLAASAASMASHLVHYSQAAK
jgi:hypothetical protein